MTKAQKFESAVTRLQIAPPENLATILEWISRDETITFFSWKLFDLKMLPGRLVAYPDFDTDKANKYIEAEQKFVAMLTYLKIRYVKLIPDELPRIFFGTRFPVEAGVFARGVFRYFKKIYPQTKVVRMEEILSRSPLRSLYEKAQKESQRTYIDPGELKNEIRLRSTYYTNKPLPRRESIKLATKAFGLFAAETAVIFKYFKNPVLLAGARSTDTYKYEFYKYPKDRPILPKLFVL